MEQGAYSLEQIENIPKIPVEHFIDHYASYNIITEDGDGEFGSFVGWASQ